MEIVIYSKAYSGKAIFLVTDMKRASNMLRVAKDIEHQYSHLLTRTTLSKIVENNCKPFYLKEFPLQIICDDVLAKDLARYFRNGLARIW